MLDNDINKKTQNKTGTNQVYLIRRLGAYLIDWYLGGLCTSFPIALISQKLNNTVLNQDITSFQWQYGYVAGVLALICAVVYFLVIPTYIYKGQTLGKKICKMKIVQESNEDITLRNMILRQIVGIMVIESGLITVSSVWHSLVMMITKVNLANTLMYIGYVITGISIILLVFRSENKAIHDYLGKTKVIVC